MALKVQPLGTGGANKTDTFSEKFQRRGEEGHFQSKNYVADFGP